MLLPLSKLGIGFAGLGAEPFQLSNHQPQGLYGWGYGPLAKIANHLEVSQLRLTYLYETEWE
jgi:hypothetical protein